MGPDEDGASDETAEDQEPGRHSSLPEEGAEGTAAEDLAQHGSAPEEGARGLPVAPAQPEPAPLGAPNWDRAVIVIQLLAGVALVVFGALLAALTKAATHDIGTAVIGIGAALLPAGAAASATARIGQSRSSSATER